MTGSGKQGYRTWDQAGGYYDGDGCVIVRVRKFVLIFYLEWVDHAKEQLPQMENFIHSKIQASTRIYRIESLDAYHLRITRQDSVLKIAKEMSGHTFKKRTELGLVADYYADKITGNEAISIINKQIEIGFRSAEPISANIPFTHSQGVKRARRRSGLTDQDIESIVGAYRNGKGIAEISRLFGKTPPTIRKTISDAWA